MKMTDQEWAKIEHFGKHENWGNPNEMEYDLVTELDEFRYTIGYPITITCGTQGKHAPNSFHHKGMAVDIILPTCPREKLPDIFFIALKHNFTAVGLYGHWKCGEKVCGGIHLDIRPTQKKIIWLCEKDGVYLPFSLFDLKRIFPV